MKSLKGYFKHGKSETPTAEPTGNDTSLPELSPNVIDQRRWTLPAPSLNAIDQRRWTLRSNLSYATGSLRNEEDIRNMKTEVMAEWLYKQQRLKLWATSGPEEGVILKRSRGEYTCCPEDLRHVRGGLFEQIAAMNVAVCYCLFPILGGPGINVLNSVP
jgi:hypothetical protein